MSSFLWPLSLAESIHLFIYYHPPLNLLPVKFIYEWSVQEKFCAVFTGLGWLRGPQYVKLEEGMAVHSSTFVWRIPWTEEPGGLQCIGSHRVRHDWSDLARVYQAVHLVELLVLTCLYPGSTLNQSPCAHLPCLLQKGRINPTKIHLSFVCSYLGWE